MLGLNLRMTEIQAAIALAQLQRRGVLIGSRVELAEELTHMMANIPDLQLPTVREGCKHVYYMHATLVLNGDRDWFVKVLNAEGVPVKAGYVTPLYRIPAFNRAAPSSCPVTERVESQIVTFEVCRYDPSRRQLKEMKDAFLKVEEAFVKREKTSEERISA